MRCRTASRDDHSLAARGRQRIVATALIAAAVASGGCAHSVSGTAVRSAKPAADALPARALLLQDDDNTPLGRANASTVGSTYFTSVQPPECSAALLFEGSPLIPAGASDHAESAYEFGTANALYAESVDLYRAALKVDDVVRTAFSTVSRCTGDAVGTSSSGAFSPMRLSFFATPGDGLLVWTMTRPDWTCDFGLAVIARAALLMTACEAKQGFPMSDWAAKRRAQLTNEVA
jgi:hypothetical protein